MQRSLRFLFVFAVLFVSSYNHALAQSSGVKNSVVQVQHDPPSMGRDLWFSLLTNYEGNTGNKYFALYITSPSKTTAWIQLTGGAAVPVTILPNKTTTFNMPLSWELQKSGEIEQKAVHVWSKDADLCCYVMSHNDATSDGFYVYPTIGWGTEYVVAGYSALLSGNSSGVVDEPSEFAIISNTDNTSVDIIPPLDIRMEGAPGSSCDKIFARAGVRTNIILNRGESIQCKTTCTQQCPWDLTGTVVRSSNPIGLICGSQCPNIPCDFSYCDHVCEMVPPVRTWSMTYYTLPFIQPPGASIEHSASTFITIASKPSQKIYRMAADGVPVLYCTLNKYEFFERNDVKEASKWFSDAPFLLVQYINGASYPDHINGNGDPAEVTVAGAEQFFRTSVFQLPASSTTFTHYVNVIANAEDTNVFLDTMRLSSTKSKYVNKLTLDGKFVGYRVANLASGSGHIVHSDSGAGVYIYGYGFDESYAYSGPMGTATLNAPDPLPAPPSFSSANGQEIVSLKDTGLSGGIYFLRTDTLLNVAYVPDSTFVEGHAVMNTYYKLVVIEPSKAARAVVSAFNSAGHHTTISTSFDAQFVGSVAISPMTQTVVGYIDSTSYAYDTIFNNTSSALPLNGLALLYGDREFRIDSAVTTDVEAGQRRIVRIAYTPKTMPYYSSDTLMVWGVKAALNGTILIPWAGVKNTSDQQVADVNIDGHHLRTSFDQTAHIELLNTAGAVVLSGDITPKGQLDVSSLATGAYFYQLRSAHVQRSGKIMIP